MSKKIGGLTLYRVQRDFDFHYDCVDSAGKFDYSAKQTDAQFPNCGALDARSSEPAPLVKGRGRKELNTEQEALLNRQVAPR